MTELTPMVAARMTSASSFRHLQWTQYGTKEYHFVMDEHRLLDLNRDAAARECSRHSEDATLISIDSEEELEFLTSEIRGRVVASGQEFAHEQWWTSGRARSGRWVWDVLGYPPGNRNSSRVPPDKDPPI